jgi:speckle-type POZ protein
LLQIKISFDAIEDNPSFVKQKIFEKSSKIGEFCSTLYDNKDFSDVILAVRESKIHAHKLVLSARSEYFAGMFGSDFKESKEKVVEIEEDEDLFKEMIEIFYTNDVSKVDFEVALELIVLARKYLVEELVKSCEEIIIKDMTLENCLEILLVADSVQSNPFKDRTIGFISANIKAAMKTPGWENLMAEKPNLALEVTTKLLE